LNPTIVALVAFGSTFCAALLGIVIRGRLPPHHLDGKSEEIVKLVLGLIATITALVLGLMISSAQSAYDRQETELRQIGVHLFQIDRTLARFGPDAVALRDLLRRMVAGDIARIWPNDGDAPILADPMSAQMEGENLFDGIAGLTPKTDPQRVGQVRALQLLSSVGETRRLLVEQSTGSLSRPSLIVLVSWSTVLFLGFGLLARFNFTVMVAFFVGALTVAGAVFLILEMNQPYTGWMQVSSAPLRDALMQMGH
jgi:hypothetical protein